MQQTATQSEQNSPRYSIFKSRNAKATSGILTLNWRFKPKFLTLRAGFSNRVTNIDLFYFQTIRRKRTIHYLSVF